MIPIILGLDQAAVQLSSLNCDSCCASLSDKDLEIAVGQVALLSKARQRA
jgi:hypothetical protein